MHAAEGLRAQVAVTSILLPPAFAGQEECPDVLPARGAKSGHVSRRLISVVFNVCVYM